jgi:hypothetical protein
LNFGEECPRVADDSSGHIHPYFDKIHSDYVYLTDFENGSLPVKHRRKKAVTIPIKINKTWTYKG